VSGSPTAAARFPDLAGRVALVTGGSRGLGAALCETLAANGVRVAVSGRDPDAIARTVARCEAAGAQAVGIAAEASDSAAVDRLVREATEALGPIDLVAAFAGFDSPEVPLVDVTDEDWHRVIEGNLSAGFYMLRAVLPGMMERRRGAIVLMSSTAARKNTVATAGYSAAKSGIIALTRKAAFEGGPHGIRVNCVAPSLIPTEGRVIPYTADQIAEGWPLGRLGVPEDVAQATTFLLSDASSWITGITVDVAGGRVLP